MSIFDSNTYADEQRNTLDSMSGVGESLTLGSPIKSMAEFRKHVIAKKQAENRGGNEFAQNRTANGSTVTFENIGPPTITEMTHNIG